MASIPTSDTLAFVTANLPESGGCRLLEVGCGTGELALELQTLGHRVTAVDSHPTAVATAVSRGVDARLAVWPEFDEEPYDGILFTRSLHHLSPLDLAVDRAWELLRPGGVLIVEDFAFSEVDERALAWFTRALELLTACEVLDETVDCFAMKLLKSNGAADAWQSEHDHDFNSAADMAQAIGRRLDLRISEKSPYFYRYLLAPLRPVPNAYAIVKLVLKQERSLIAADAFDALGRRFVACRLTGWQAT